MRGIASIANAVTPRSASARVLSALVSGARKPISTEPLPSCPISSIVGVRTTATTSAPQASEADPMVAPASVYAESRKCACSPAPASTTVSTPRADSFFAVSGTSATRLSPWADWFGTPSFIGGRGRVTKPLRRPSAGCGQLEPPEVLRLARDARQEGLAVGVIVGPCEHQQLG